jgi:hypothetical protein
VATSAQPNIHIDIGKVLSGAFRAIASDFLPYFLLSLIIAGGTAFLWELLLERIDTVEEFSLSLGLIFVGGTLLWSVATTLVQAAIVRSSVLRLNGRPANFAGSVTTALAMLPSLLGLAMLVGFVIAFGLVLLIVPGIIFCIMYMVVVPALLEERHGVLDSMKRSAELTKGTRLPIFGLLIVLLILEGGIEFAFFSIGNQLLEKAGVPMSWGSAGTDALGATISAMLDAVVVASLYVELRTAKEGAASQMLADIFE